MGFIKPKSADYHFREINLFIDYMNADFGIFLTHLAENLQNCDSKGGPHESLHLSIQFFVGFVLLPNIQDHLSFG
jgi:hypothetical protein